MFYLDISAGTALLSYDEYNVYKYSDWFYDGKNKAQRYGSQYQNVAFYFVGLYSCLTTGVYKLLISLNYKPGVYNLTVKEEYFQTSYYKLVEIGMFNFFLIYILIFFLQPTLIY